jgi:DNA-binding phage protein
VERREIARPIVELRFTPEQKEQWQAAAQQELSDREENVAYFRKVTAAAERPGFSGDLRRAMASSGRPMEQLAAEIGVDSQHLSDSRAGDAELPAAALDRLIHALSLRLMREIEG